MDPWLIPVKALRRVIGSARPEQRRGTLGRLSVADSVVGAEEVADAEVTLSAVDGGIEVSGRVSAPYTGSCRRCGQGVAGRVVADVRELYRPRTGRDRSNDMDEETYELGVDHLDLAPLVRDAVVLELPVAPLCRTDCAGLCDRCGADLNTEPCGCDRAPVDDRWAVLDVLREPPGPALS